VCASWLELSAGTRADDLSRSIASHLEKAGLADAAARAYLRAARLARASYRGPQAVQLFDRALSLLSLGDAPTRLDALHDRGVVQSLLGRIDDASRSFTEMYQIAHRYGARNKMAAALGRLGRIARGRGEFDTARGYFEGALPLFRLAEDARGIAATEDDLGILAFIAGDLESAIEHSTRALEMRRNLEDPLGEALSTHNLGLVHFARGQPRQARAHFERALALRERHGDIEGTITTRNVLAALAYDRGDIEQAESIWREILELAEALGDKRIVLYATCNLAEAATYRGEVTLASQLLDGAELLCSELDDKRAQAEIERSRAVIAKAAGDTDRAQFHFEQSLAIAQQLGVREAEALALRGLGETFAQTILDPEAPPSHRAEPYFEDAIRILDEVGATRELARTRASYGTMLIERGNTPEGRKQLAAALPVLERLELSDAGRIRGLLNSTGGPAIAPTAL
jgi:tetratricopeptide (TPR) repeat protein